MPELLTVDRVAEILGLTKMRVYQLDEELEPRLTPRGSKQVTRHYDPAVVERVRVQRAARGCGHGDKPARQGPRPGSMHRKTFAVDPSRIAFSSGQRALWNSHCYGATKRNLANELTIADFYAMASQPCTYCGECPVPRKVGRCRELVVAHGVDRFDNAEGYTLDNCIPCCFPCNRAKSTMSAPDFIKHIRKIAEHCADLVIDPIDN